MHTTVRDVPVQYDESTRTYRLSCDGGRDYSISTTIILAVSEITNTPPVDIDPMYEVVDPDALDDLYPPMINAALRRGGCSTSFRFHDCDVTVYSAGEIELRPLDDADDLDGAN